jgi:hypothetical protein
MVGHNNEVGTGHSYGEGRLDIPRREDEFVLDGDAGAYQSRPDPPRRAGSGPSKEYALGIVLAVILLALLIALWPNGIRLD